MLFLGLLLIGCMILCRGGGHKNARDGIGGICEWRSIVQFLESGGVGKGNIDIIRIVAVGCEPSMNNHIYSIFVYLLDS
jgi:hypothetical protein